MVPSKPQPLLRLLPPFLSALVFPVCFLAEGVLSEPRPLPFAAPIEGTLEGSRHHSFFADLEAGQNIRIVVEQLGIDVVVEVAGPGSTSRLLVDSPLGKEGAESVSMTAEVSGRYHIEVRPANPTDATGRYSIRAQQMSTATAVERLRLQAEAINTTAARLYAMGNDPDRRAARNRLREALVTWRTLGDFSRLAQTWRLLGLSQAEAGEHSRALESFSRAVSWWRRLDDPGGLAAGLESLGRALGRRGEAARALPPLREALDLRRQRGADEARVAELQNHLCLQLQRAGRWPEAGECYEDVSHVARRLGDTVLEARVLNNLGGVAANLGEPERALERYRRALEIRRALGDRLAEAQTLNNLGALFRGLGELDQALRSFERAASLFEQENRPEWRARALSNLGSTYLSLGDLERARSFLLSALPLRRQVGDRSGEAVTLRNLGWASARLGESGKALAFYQKALERSLELEDRRGIASARKLLGELYLELGDTEAAETELQGALESLGAMGKRREEAEALEILSRIRLAQGRRESAGELATRSLQLFGEVRDPLGELDALISRARIERASGRLRDALESLEAALGVFEDRHRDLIPLARKASFLASQRQAFELLVDTSMDLHRLHPDRGFDRAALEASERARSRSLLALLGDSAAGLGPDLAPELRTRLRAAERQVTAKANRQLRLLGAGAAAVADPRAEQELYRALSELESIRAEVRLESPRYVSLRSRETLDAAAIHGLLDPETALLELFLGESHSFLWWVTDTAMIVHELPSRIVIEEAARRVHDLLRRPGGDSAEQRRALATLAEILLRPVAEQLAHQRLVFVADGALHLVPFAALPSPADGQPLLLSHEVLRLPSASALAAQRGERNRSASSALDTPGSLAILADPVFDPREGDFEQLPHTRREATAIAQLLPADEVFLALGNDARRDRVLGRALEPFRQLHFATHGWIHPRTPELSGLVLSQLDPEGNPLDGFLSLSDVSNLQLSAELVVLSGCGTALGKQVRGEGILGLAHGFQVAGADRVMASLWQVRDQATAAFMTHFYRAHLVQGQTPAAALRTAQIELRQDRRYRDPFFWAAFTLQGDWRYQH